jgi:hypothetical protein
MLQMIDKTELKFFFIHSVRYVYFISNDLFKELVILYKFKKESDIFSHSIIFNDATQT